MKEQIRIPVLPDKKHILALVLSAAAVAGLGLLPSTVRDGAQLEHQVQIGAKEELEKLEEFLKALEGVDLEKLGEEEQVELQELVEAMKLSQEELAAAGRVWPLLGRNWTLSTVRRTGIWRAWQAGWRTLSGRELQRHRLWQRRLPDSRRHPQGAVSPLQVRETVKAETRKTETVRETGMVTGTVREAEMVTEAVREAEMAREVEMAREAEAVRDPAMARETEAVRDPEAAKDPAMAREAEVVRDLEADGEPAAAVPPMTMSAYPML